MKTFRDKNGFQVEPGEDWNDKKSDETIKFMTKPKNIPYTEINISLNEDKREEMLKKSNGRRTIPQIFIEDYHVGGYVELRALENKGELDNLLK